MYTARKPLKMAEGAAQSLTYDVCDPMQVEERTDDDDQVSGGDFIAGEAVHAQAGQHAGRKRVRNPDSWKKKHIKRKGLRQNAPQMTVEALVSQICCKKACVQQISAEHLSSIRQHFSTMTHEEQNLYLTGLMIKKETKKSVGHKRKSDPKVGKYGKKVGRPAAEESSFSVEYQIRNERGLNQKVCQKAFLLIHGFGK